MLGLAGIPSVIQFIGFMFMPESPRWLVGKDREFEARNASFASIRYDNDVITYSLSNYFSLVNGNEEVLFFVFVYFQVLMKIRGTSDIDQELDDIKSTCEESERLKEQTGKREFGHQPNLRIYNTYGFVITLYFNQSDSLFQPNRFKIQCGSCIRFRLQSRELEFRIEQ